jgi:hypothetical protein
LGSVSSLVSEKKIFEIQLKPNCPGMIIGRSSTKYLFFYADWKSKMATTAGHRITLIFPI